MTTIDEAAIEAAAKAIHDLEPFQTDDVLSCWHDLGDTDWTDFGGDVMLPPKEHYRECAIATLVAITEAGYAVIRVPPGDDWQETLANTLEIERDRCITEAHNFAIMRWDPDREKAFRTRAAWCETFAASLRGEE